MDVEAFFDRLYSHFCVHFPCYALYERGKGFRTEPANDGTASLVLFTDEDLLARHRASQPDVTGMPIGFHDHVALGRILDKLPRRITHVAFDPNPRFHRRYPVGVIRDSLKPVAGKAPKV